MNDYVKMVLLGVLAIALEILLWWAINQVTTYADESDIGYIESFSSDSEDNAIDQISPTPTPTPTQTPTPTITPTPVLHPETVDFYSDVIDRIDAVYDGTVKILISIWVLVGVLVGYGVVKDVFG